MKTIKTVTPQPITQKITFFQVGIDETILNNELTFELTFESNVNTLVGNFYEIISDFKESNAKLFNFSLPIILRVENINEKNESELILNTGLALKQLQSKCKLQWNKKGRLRFKNNVAICVRASQRKIKPFTAVEFDALNEKLG
tara:strand:+ start:237 stop:668 length:432 start_codon:yes stop_codon:yes gene_type:complete